MSARGSRIVRAAAVLALLMGSLLVFVCVAAAMVATRRLDWYSVGANLPGARASEAQKPA